MSIDLKKGTMNFLGELKLKTIQSLPRLEIGDIVYCEDTKEFLTYTEDGWQEFILSTNDLEVNENSSLDLYSFNKMIMGQMPHLDEEDIAKGQTLVNTFSAYQDNYFYMLYGKEISYFTLFQRDISQVEDIGEGVLNCIKDLGYPQSIQLTEDKSAIEIWVEDENKVSTVLYFFPYDNGIYPVRF